LSPRRFVRQAPSTNGGVGRVRYGEISRCCEAICSGTSPLQFVPETGVMSSGRSDSELSNEAKFAAISREAEAQGFYARHDQTVDFINWSRESFWSAEEAIALFFGLEPEDVKWDALEQAVAHSALAGDIFRLHK